MEQGQGFTLMHRDEFEHPYPKWWLARRSLGLSSFGLNLCELQPGETIPEHTEVQSDQEEVYIVLEGSPTIVIDGRDHPFPAGTFARLDPHPSRTIRNDGPDPALVLMASAPRTSGFKPLDWA